MKCTADSRPSPKTFADYMDRLFHSDRIPCGKPALYNTVLGPRCLDHGEQLVDAVMGDSTLLGMIIQHKGQRPATREEARKRYLKTIQ